MVEISGMGNAKPSSNPNLGSDVNKENINSIGANMSQQKRASNSHESLVMAASSSYEHQI